jgi:uncharacterized protein YabE (DUF348 family)
MESDVSSTNQKSTTFKAILLAIAAVLFVFLVSSAADLMLLKDEPARLTIEISDAVSALAIGLLAYQLIRLQQQKRARVRQRLEIIADMNHHVRNALQVISLTTHGHEQSEIVTIRESVNRIQWALKELLPKI